MTVQWLFMPASLRSTRPKLIALDPSMSAFLWGHFGAYLGRLPSQSAFFTLHQCVLRYASGVELASAPALWS